MSATQEVIEPRNDVERLVQDILRSGIVRFSLSSGDGFFHVNLSDPGQEQAVCSCHHEQWIVRTASWTVSARLDNTQRVRFVRRRDPHHPEREDLSINLIGPNGQTALSGYFGQLYDDPNRPLAAPFARWEELRAKYGGREEVLVLGGRIISS